MAEGSARPAIGPEYTERPSRRGDLLVKADHARFIDRYIDYFGGQPAAWEKADACGEALSAEIVRGYDVREARERLHATRTHRDDPVLCL